MTQEQRICEWDHEYKTRIGMICGYEEPTPQDKDEAARAADEHITAIEKGES